jgi:hypothetical protein
MEKNAKGELHLADQPLDMLFFESRHELLIPWDLDQLAARGSSVSSLQLRVRTMAGHCASLINCLPTSLSTLLWSR